MANQSSIDSGNTSVFLDLPLLESAAGISLAGADSEGEAFSEEFQVGFSITEDTDFTFETDPFAPVDGTIEHSGTVTLTLGDAEVTVGEFSIGFDAERVSDTASGFFVADTTEDALDLEVLFDVGAPGNVTTDEGLTVSDADLLVAPEFAEALGSEDLAGADIGDTRIDASTEMVESSKAEPQPQAEVDTESEVEMDSDMESSKVDTESEAEVEVDMGSEADSDGESGTAKNVIIMIGDGMGWEMARAAAIQKMINEGAEGDTLTDFYTEGVGEGLSFQELEGYAISTTSNTYIDGDKGNSALQGDPFNHNTGESEVREGFEFDPSRALVQGFFPEIRDPAPEESEEASDGVPEETASAFIPGFNPENGFVEDPLELASGEILGGNVPIYNPELGGALPWLDGEDPEYIKNLYPDSAGTATSLYTGVKTYVGAIGVDIFEESVETLAEAVKDEGKSAGVVSSVPFNHATPAAAISHVNNRDKTHGESFEQVNGEDEEFRNEAGELVDEFGHEIADNDNIFTQIVEEVQPDLVLGAGHADTRDGDERYITYDQLDELRNGEYPYTFLERGENAAEVLAQTAAEIDVEAGDNLFGIYGARGQGGNLPWRTANDDYSNTGLDSRLDAERPLEEGETVESFIETELDANPTLMDMTSAALDVMEDDPDGFWLSIEGGDIDWAAHDNNLDNMLGTTMDFAESVELVMDWIEENGGYEETQLIVTADHDHYFTLTEDYPELLREQGAEAMTVQVGEDGEPLLTDVDEEGEALVDDDGNTFQLKVDLEDVEQSGHYWGSDPNEKYGWGTHTTRPVPVYYQGVGSEYFEEVTGEGYEAYGEEVAGVDGFIDQIHIAEAQFNAFGLTPGENRDVINLLTEEDSSVDVSAEVDAGFENVGGFYQAIDAEGTVIDPISGEEVAVGDEGYEAAALASSVTLLGDGETTTLDLEGGSVYVPYLLADGDQFFSSLASANPEGIDHVKSLSDNSFGFEDLVGGGDRDFNDFVLTAEAV